MLIEIEVTESKNSDLGFTRMFSTIGPTKKISRVRTVAPDGVEGFYYVAGWSSSGAVQAYSVKVEDSGEGVAMLVYGGDEGIRFKRTDLTTPWDLADSEQWGEPMILIDQDSEVD